MTRICVTAGNADEIRKFREAGADEIVLAPEGCAMSALPEFSTEEIAGQGTVSLLMNRLFMPEMLVKAEAVLDTVRAEQIDSVYFSDPAMVPIAEKRGLKDRLIYKPEMLAVSTFDAQWWMAQGIASVSVSPLLTRDEIMSILNRIPGLQITVHGRLLMSVSARPLLSAYREDTGTVFDVNSRQLFLKEDKREELMPVYETASGTFIYSDFIQESFDDVKLFAEAGAGSFFIDSVGCDPELIADALVTLKTVMNEPDAGEAVGEYRRKYAGVLSEGYYGQKTIR